MIVPEYQVLHVLENPDATLAELIDSLHDMAVQYGYIAGMAAHGLRENAEVDLVRTLCIIKVIKQRIHNIQAS